ncbi:MULTISPECIES: hypothetical protein [unclassified Geodermatophilus]|uniref:hypothetical protein n=1 Tax=unclassified Geodermatophilus TaxID=2637632 RepID=UPI003EEBCFA0
MNEALSLQSTPFDDLNAEEKSEYLHVLADVVADIESELARAKAERSALVRSLQADLERDLDEFCRPTASGAVRVSEGRPRTPGSRCCQGRMTPANVP